MGTAGKTSLQLTVLVVLAALVWCGPTHAITPTNTYVQVTISPAEAVTAGAQWKLDVGTWNNSGATIATSAGAHTIAFKSVPGWETPAPKAVTAPSGTTTQDTGTYRQYALCEGVGACNRPWESLETPPNQWLVDEAVNHDGHNALRSPDCAAATSSRVATTVQGPVTVTWWCKFSANATDSQLYLFVDTAINEVLSVTQDWTQKTLILGDGKHDIEWLFYQGATNMSGPDTAWLDQFLVVETTPPTGSMVINNNASATASHDVTLGLSYGDGDGSGVIGMRFSNDGATWSPWETPVATKVWTLPAGEGYRTVRAQFRDKAGNKSIVHTDYILVDGTAPTGSIQINGGAAGTDTPDATLNLTWDDGGGSGVSRMRFSNDGATWSAWEPASATKAWTLVPGVGNYITVRVQFLDRAGNKSAVYKDYIKVVIT